MYGSIRSYPLDIRVVSEGEGKKKKKEEEGLTKGVSRYIETTAFLFIGAYPWGVSSIRAISSLYISTNTAMKLIESLANGPLIGRDDSQSGP